MLVILVQRISQNMKILLVPPFMGVVDGRFCLVMCKKIWAFRFHASSGGHACEEMFVVGGC